MMVVNGRTWPYLEVEQRRYRFRYLNGCDSRFLILAIDQRAASSTRSAPTAASSRRWPRRTSSCWGRRNGPTSSWTSATCPKAPIVTLNNLGPDEPFGGGVPGGDFDPADPGSTGQVMQFRVVKRNGADKSTPVADLVLPAIVPYGEPR